MRLDDSICHSCTLHDSKAKMKDTQPFLVSADNNMDPGDCYSRLPEPFDFERFSTSSTVALQDRQVDAIERSKRLVCIPDGILK